MKSAQIPEPQKIEIVDIPIPELRESEVLIKVMACGICGTDIHIFRGEYLGDYPVVPGHEISGVIQEIGKKVKKFKREERVAVEPNIACENCCNCLNNRQNFCANWRAIGVTRPGGMAQYVVVPEQNVFNIGNIPFELGAFVEPLSCVIHGIERAGISLADKIAILGAGPIGMLLLKTAKLQGALEITLVDKNDKRLHLAKNAGADFIYGSLKDLRQDYFDVVIDATGVISVMRETINYVRPGGRVLLFGVPPSGKNMEIEPFIIFRKGLTILSSFTSLKNSYQAVGLLESGKIDVADLVSHKLQLNDLKSGMEMIERGTNNVMKVMILPNTA